MKVRHVCSGLGDAADQPLQSFMYEVVSKKWQYFHRSLTLESESDKNFAIKCFRIVYRKCMKNLTKIITHTVIVFPMNGIFVKIIRTP